MALYPQNTRFFLNLWTWGYEDIMKAIARSFGTKVRDVLKQLWPLFKFHGFIDSRRPVQEGDIFKDQI